MSEQAQHTPGPWTQHRGEVIGPRGSPVAGIRFGRGGISLDSDEAWANARLISAAPDMKQCGNLLSSCAHDFLEEQTDINAERLALAVEGWNAAIAKAEQKD